jgi:dihydroneopterin aldolase
MMQISLTNLEFFGYHGLYEAEKKLGNQFLVDVVIDFTEPDTILNQLSQTIDYVEVHQLVKKIMATPTSLLETLVCKIADQILIEYVLAEKVFVKITKQKLPIANFMGDTAVSIQKVRG